MTQTSKASSDVAYLCRALKAPSMARAVDRLAERARQEEWSHEEFLAACLEREVAARQTNGGELRIKAARFPARKTIEDFDFSFQRSLKRDTMLHLGSLDFVAARENVVFLGPPGTGKTHLAVGLGIRACQGDIGWLSPPPLNGWAVSAKPTPRVASKKNSPVWGGSPFSSSTKSDISPSKPKPPTCSSNSSQQDTNKPR